LGLEQEIDIFTLKLGQIRDNFDRKRTILSDNDLQLRNDLAIIQQKVNSDAKVAYIYIYNIFP